MPPIAAALVRAGAALMLGLALARCATSAPATPGPQPPGLAPGAPGASGAPGDAVIDAATALLTFDSAWSRIAASHYDEDYGGVDWAAVRIELRPRAAAATSLHGLRRVLDDMLGRLGESHFVLIPASSASPVDRTGAPSTSTRGAAGEPGEPGLEVRLVEGRLTVARVAPGGAAAAAGIAPGWLLLALDGQPLAARVAAAEVLPAAARRLERTRLLHGIDARLRGGAGERRVLTLRDGRGVEVERTLELRPAGGRLVAYGNLPPMLAVVEHSRVPVDGGCIGRIRLNVWLVPLMPAIDDAIDDVRDCIGIVLDLRGNPGGVAGMVMGVAGHFVGDTLLLGRLRTRTADLRFLANPRRVRRDGSSTAPLAAPLAVLVDEMSASTSEIFAAALQAHGRARVFGTPSAGQALPALMLRLPTGDVLMHVVADFTGPDGRRIEGRGVVPDELAAPTRQDLIDGRDPPLDAAIAWIQLRRNRP